MVPAPQRLPGRGTWMRAATVSADPVTAAGLGWLGYPDRLRLVRDRPDAYLEAEEAAAFRQDETALRLVVLARVEGIPFERSGRSTARTGMR